MNKSPFYFRFAQRGASLMELVLSIVIIGLALAGIIVVINRNVLSSADPMVQDQAVAIAEAYLDEILLKNFCDPGSTCTAGTPFPGATCNLCPAAELDGLGNRDRPNLDNVCDYNGVNDAGARDQTGALIAALAAYNVQATVFTDGTATLGTLTSAACQVMRVEVSVTGPNGVNYGLTGYRTNYP